MYSSPIGRRFAVLWTQSCDFGPCVSFWPAYDDVIALLLSHMNHGLKGFVVWERRTPTANHWKQVV